MISVVDHVSPCPTPSSTFAKNRLRQAQCNWL
jgi:hypothetical protein